MPRVKGKHCKKCGSQMKKCDDFSIVVDITYYKEHEKKYRTLRSVLCKDCLKGFGAAIKEFKLERKKPDFDLGLG